MTTNNLTDQDRRAVREFLRDWGYASLEDWALEDSEYYTSEVSSEWYSVADVGPWASPVDLEVECFRFIERQGEAQDEQRYGFF